MDPDRQKLEEIYRIERENNKMLRSMNRRAWWGTIFRLAMLAVALGVPIWIYFNYLAPVLEQFNAIASEMSGTRVQIQDQFSGFADMFEKFREYFGTSTTQNN